MPWRLIFRQAFRGQVGGSTIARYRVYLDAGLFVCPNGRFDEKKCLRTRGPPGWPIEGWPRVPFPKVRRRLDVVTKPGIERSVLTRLIKEIPLKSAKGLHSDYRGEGYDSESTGR